MCINKSMISRTIICFIVGQCIVLLSNDKQSFLFYRQRSPNISLLESLSST